MHYSSFQSGAAGIIIKVKMTVLSPCEYKLVERKQFRAD